MPIVWLKIVNVLRMTIRVTSAVLEDERVLKLCSEYQVGRGGSQFDSVEQRWVLLSAIFWNCAREMSG